MKQYLKMADAKDLFDGIVADGHELWCENGWTGEMLDHKSAKYTVHAINSHDELVQMNQELLAAAGILADRLFEVPPGVDIALDAIRETISKAKGGAV